MSKKEKTILVVDDSPVMQKLTEKTLINNNFTVFSAYNAEECLREARNRRPTIILMDVILPDRDGKEVVEELQQDADTKDIPVIFTTNTLSLEADDGTLQIDVNGIKYRAFAKPLHYRKLLSAIRKEINRSVHGGDLPPGKS